MAKQTFIVKASNTDTEVTVETMVTLAAIEPPNVDPEVNAGTNQSIVLPTNTVTLNGTANDSDGVIVSYLWTQTFGFPATIENPNSPTTRVTNLKEGLATFRLEVTDDDGGTSFSTVNIIVNPEPVVEVPEEPEVPGTLVFQTGYNSASDVNTNQGRRNTISTSVKSEGAASFRSEVRASDESQSSGYRGEMQYSSSVYNPTEAIVTCDVYFENWRRFGGGGHVWQWHPDNGTGSATVCLYAYDGKFMVVRNWDGINGGVNYYQSGTLKTITPNKWYKLRWEYKWSNSSDGYVRLFIDGDLYYSYNGRTTSTKTGIPYLKVGQNRWSMPSGTNTVVYYDDLKIYKR